MMDGLVRKRGGGREGALQKKNDPDCCCDVERGNAGSRTCGGLTTKKRVLQGNPNADSKDTTQNTK